MLGLKREAVRVVDPQPAWAGAYERIADEILGAAAHLDFELEHIGSTSVPGLAAKPIVDVGVLLGAPDAFPALETSLTSIGLAYRGDKGARGGRLFIRESAPGHRTHHVHVWFRGAPEWTRYLVFRDRLRADPSLRDAYAALKRTLAKRLANDRFAYLEGKTDFVHGVLAMEDS